MNCWGVVAENGGNFSIFSMLRSKLWNHLLEEVEAVDDDDEFVRDLWDYSHENGISRSCR